MTFENFQTSEQIHKATPQKESDLENLHDKIVELDIQDTQWQKTGEDYRKKSEEGLQNIRKELKELRSEYGDSSNMDHLEKMYQDLLSDFKNGRSLDLDSSLVEQATIIKNQIEGSEITPRSTEEISDENLKIIASQLEGLGMNIEYVVQTPKKNSPTVILMPQIHPNSGMSKKLRDVSGATQSQTEIENAIEKLISAKLTKTIFTEGVPNGEKIEVEDAKLNLEFGISQAKLRHREELDIIGIENLNLLRKSLLEIDNPIVTMLRQTINNIILADNLTDQIIDRNLELSVIIMGANHELDITSNKNTHKFPLSHLIAYSGANVLVVNKPEFNKEDFVQFLEQNPEEIENPTKNHQH